MSHKQSSEERYAALILDVIRQEIGGDVGIFLFGSRARSENQEFSDFDIGLYTDHAISEKSMRRINETLVESKLPFKVDVVDFYQAKKEFQKIATEKIIIWQNPSMIQSWIKNLKN